MIAVTDSPETLVLAGREPSLPARQWLERELPNASRVAVGRRRVEGFEYFRPPELPKLYLRHYVSVVIVEGLCAGLLADALRAIGLSVRAKQRWLLDAGELIPWGLREEAKARAQALWIRERRPSDRGFGNDFGFVEPVAPGALREFPTLSLIVPVYNRKAHLARTLAGLAHQSYPRDRFEVVVADDGSSDAPESLNDDFEAHLRLKWVRQGDRGYRLSAVRNLALRAAEHDVIVSLDCDMYPNPDFLRSYARWFAATDSPLLVVGDRRFVDAHGVDHHALLQDPHLIRRLPVAVPPASGGASDTKLDWRHRSIVNSAGLRTHREPYRMTSGGNVAYRREDALDVGGYDESFEHWGGEDTDFAYRMVTGRGAYVVFEAGAYAYHQDHPEAVPREEHKKKTLSQLGARVPHYRHECREPVVRPEASVYMPARNVERWIEVAVKSVLLQGFRDLELCVVNDGSVDSTGEILDRLAASDPRMRVQHFPESRGIAAASRQAVGMCRGEFIIQLDSDDELLPGAVGTLVRTLRSDPELSLVYGGFVREDAEGNLLWRNLGRPFVWSQALVANVVSHPRAFRARDYHRISGFDLSLHNAVDFDFYLQLAQVGRVAHVPQILYRQRWHGQNTSIRERAEQIKNHRVVSERAIRRYRSDWRLEVSDPHEPKTDRVIDAAGRPVERTVRERIGRVARRVTALLPPLALVLALTSTAGS